MADSFAKEIGKNAVNKAVGIGLGIGAGYFLVVRPILVAVGVIKTKEEKQNDKNELENSVSTSSPWNPNYYKTIKGGALITKDAATKLSASLYNARGVFNDNEEQVYGALRQLKAKTQLSWVADVFFQKYNQDLYTYLRSFLDDKEMSIVNGIAKNLS